MKKFKIFLILLLFVVFSGYGAGGARAEVVTFRIPRLGLVPGTDVQRGACYPMSLTENLSAKVDGKTGANCTFDIEVKPLGEWVSAGGYYNTPPYAWGQDKFYSISQGSFSFTCKNSDLTLDKSGLPQYVNILSEDEIPATSSHGPGKKYTIEVGEDVGNNDSFNLNFGMSSDCSMYRMESGSPKLMTAVEPNDLNENSCGLSNKREINPREVTLKYQVSLGDSCAPPATATPKPPACGEGCDPDNNRCVQECPICADDGSGNAVCTAEPTQEPPPPACGEGCDPDNNRCVQECPICEDSGSGPVCVAPPPTDVPPPSCGDVCDPNSNECTLECPVCEDSGSGPVCVAAPTATPAPPSCGDVCDPSSNECSLDCPVCEDSGSGPVCVAAPTSEPPPPSCGDVCDPSSNQCTQDCPVCEDSGSGPVCVAEAPTDIPAPTDVPQPTTEPQTVPPTTAPVCGVSCVAGVDSCPVECPVCAPGSSSAETICRTEASCDCDGFEYVGELTPGNTATFTTYAKVGNPDTNNAEVRYMTYHVEENGVEIANSGDVPASAPERTTDDGGAEIDRYNTTWDYTIPDTQSDGTTTYRVYTKITCGYKSGVAPQSAIPVAEPNIFEKVIQFFMNILGIRQVQAQGNFFAEIGRRVATFIDPIFEAIEPPDWALLHPTPTPETMDTLKLGTFDPIVTPTPTPVVELGCKQVIFTINK